MVVQYEWVVEASKTKYGGEADRGEVLRRKCEKAPVGGERAKMWRGKPRGWTRIETRTKEPTCDARRGWGGSESRV